MPLTFDCIPVAARDRDLRTDFFREAKGLDFPPTADKGDPAGEPEGSGVDRDLRTYFFREAKGLSCPLSRG